MISLVIQISEYLGVVESGDIHGNVNRVYESFTEIFWSFTVLDMSEQEVTVLHTLGQTTFPVSNESTIDDILRKFVHATQLHADNARKLYRGNEEIDLAKYMRNKNMTEMKTYGDGTRIKVSGETFRASRCVVNGSGNTVYGNGNRIHGEGCVVYGEDNQFLGVDISTEIHSDGSYVRNGSPFKGPMLPIHASEQSAFSAVTRN